MTREEKTAIWMAQRPRAGETQTVTFPTKTNRGKGKPFKNKKKNKGLPRSGKVTVTIGWCPCSICNHEFMWECEEANGGGGCDCCSSTCT